MLPIQPPTLIKTRLNNLLSQHENSPSESDVSTFLDVFGLLLTLLLLGLVEFPFLLDPPPSKERDNALLYNNLSLSLKGICEFFLSIVFTR
uniref:Uncharacterized protein n=1 Tax=Schistosoma curassoni TaxID=6186 RepID=A0A183L4R6_9TREM